MKLPSGKDVYNNTPIYPGSNFTWGEATKNCSRCPQNLFIDCDLILSSIRVEQNIIQTAKNLDQVREILGGKALFVNSWYRPKDVNSRVGGSKWSRHQYGDAVDIRSGHLTAYTVYDLLNAKYLRGGLGKYSNFVHIDWRSTRVRW